MSDRHPVIEDAVAIVPVRDVQASIDFYTDILEFEVRFAAPDGSFATVVHGEAALHFLKTDDAASLQATANHISVYLWVKELDALYAHLEARLDSLPEGRVRPPFDQAYGMREFHVKDPDGCLLFFGESLERD